MIFSSAFAPYINGPGLRVGVSPGSVIVGGVPTNVSGSIVSLTANATNSVYLNTGTGVVTVATTGFPTSNAYPIATVVTGTTAVTSMVDVRSDISAGAGGVVLLSTTTITATQFKAMDGTTPTAVTLIPAQTGSVISPIMITCNMQYGGTPYTGGITPNALVAGWDSAGLVPDDYILLHGASIKNANASRFNVNVVSPASGGTETLTFYAGALLCGLSGTGSGPYTVGNSPFVVNTWYSLVTAS